MIIEQIKAADKLSQDSLHREHDYGADVAYIANTMTSQSYGFIHAATVYGTHCLVMRGPGEFSTQPERYCFGMSTREHILKDSCEAMIEHTAAHARHDNVFINYYDTSTEKLKVINAEQCRTILQQWRATVESHWKARRKSL